MTFTSFILQIGLFSILFTALTCISRNSPEYAAVKSKCHIPLFTYFLRVAPYLLPLRLQQFTIIILLIILYNYITYFTHNQDIFHNLYFKSPEFTRSHLDNLTEYFAEICRCTVPAFLRRFRHIHIAASKHFTRVFYPYTVQIFCNSHTRTPLEFLT